MRARILLIILFLLGVTDLSNVGLKAFHGLLGHKGKGTGCLLLVSGLWTLSAAGSGLPAVPVAVPCIPALASSHT